MFIRPELPSEYAIVEAIHLLSFSKAFAGAGPYEAGVVAKIRQSENFVPELSLVAIEEDKPVGHILFSYLGLQDQTGPLRRVMVLAPLAIHPDHQNKGIGTALVQAGLEKLEARQEPLVIVRGHPGYYPRFGFVPSVGLGIRPPSGVAEEAYMALALKAYGPEYRGVVVYPAAFDRGCG
jgi:putative acetyltransferase